MQKAGLADSFVVDSAGTGAWHIGNPPDPRSIEIAARHEVDISSQRARQVRANDFRRFDTIVAMDRDNLAGPQAHGRSEQPPASIAFEQTAQDVPDPYYGGPDGFEQVYQLVRTGGQRLLQDLMTSA